MDFGRNSWNLPEVKEGKSFVKSRLFALLFSFILILQGLEGSYDFDEIFARLATFWQHPATSLQL